MLRITVEIFPGGDESRRRELAHADIGNVSMGALSRYVARVYESGIDDVKTAEISEYPRWSASVWDLVARCVAKALTGKEEIPAHPTPLQIPVSACEGIRYVRHADMPEPARSAFRERMQHSTGPVIAHESDPMGCAYEHDWLDFLRGRK